MTSETDWRRHLRCLEDPARRRLLVALLDRNPLPDELDVPEDVPLGEKDPAAAEVPFEHVHLPMLESCGFISWDQEAGVVTKGPTFEEIRPLLRLIEDHRDELPDGWR